MYTLLSLLPLSIFNIVHLHDFTSQGESTLFYKQNKTKQKKPKRQKKQQQQQQQQQQITPCVLDAELDCFEDFDLKKDFEPIKMNHS